MKCWYAHLKWNLGTISNNVKLCSYARSRGKKLTCCALSIVGGVERDFGLLERAPWLTLVGMQNNPDPTSTPGLKILPAYTGLNTVEAILQVPRARRLLWLEILFNDQLDLQPWQKHPEVQDAYQKACQWFTTYRSLIQSVLPRVSLPLDNGKIDQRDYRTFAEALQFVTHQS